MDMTEAPEHPIVHLELTTGNLPRASRFYAELLGWAPQRIDTASGRYLALAMGGFSGGVVECETPRPAWLPYVEVDDIAAVTDRARSLGAFALLGPREGPAGWRSVVASSAGGEIALWQPKTQVLDREPTKPQTSTGERNAR